MNFLIDYDTRSVQCKSSDTDLLAAYVKDNGLEMAVAIISGEDDFLMEMSFSEVNGLFHNISDNKRKFENEEDAAKFCWSLLQTEEDEFPEFTAKLGKKLLQDAAKLQKDKAVPNPTASKKPPAKATTGAEKPTAKKVKLEGSEEILVIDGKCKSGSILHTIVTAIETELCETAEEIAGYITTNHIIPKTGELADEKFAWHNIKYFIKQGKLSAEEGL